MLKKLSTNAFYLFSSDVGARLLGFWATMHIARALGTEHFGWIVIALSVLSYAQWLADMGLTTLGTRELARPYSSRDYQLPDFLQTKFSLTLLVFLFMQLGISLFPLPRSLVLLLRVYLFFLFIDAFFLEWYCKAIQRYSALTVSRWLSGGIYLLGVTLYVRSPGDVLRVPAFYLLGLFLAAIVLFFRKRDEDRVFPRQFSLHRSVALLRNSVSIGMAAFFAQVVLLLPPLILGALYSPSQAGVYGAAVKIIILFQLFDRVFVALFLPSLSGLWAVSPQKVAPRLKGILNILTWFTFSIVSMIIIYASHLMTIVYGNEYRQGIGVLMILSGFILFTVFNSVFSYTLIAIGKQQRYLRGTMKGSLLAILFIVGFTVQWGAMGTAVGVVLGECAIALFVYAEFRRYFSIPFGKPVLRAGLYSFGFTLLVATLHLDSLWLLPLLWIGFLAGVVALGGVRWQNIKEAISR